MQKVEKNIRRGHSDFYNALIKFDLHSSSHASLRVLIEKILLLFPSIRDQTVILLLFFSKLNPKHEFRTNRQTLNNVHSSMNLQQIILLSNGFRI